MRNHIWCKLSRELWPAGCVLVSQGFGDAHLGAWFMDAFDLIQLQQEAREITTPKELFNLWERVCSQYDRGKISKYELEEMKAVIWPNLHYLNRIKKMVDQSFSKQVDRVA